LATAEINTKGIVPLNPMNHIRSVLSSVAMDNEWCKKKMLRIPRINSVKAPQNFPLHFSVRFTFSPSCWLCNYDVCVDELITLSLPLHSGSILSCAVCALLAAHRCCRAPAAVEQKVPRALQDLSEWVCVVIFIHVCGGSGRATRRNCVSVCNCRRVNRVVQ
jgi:hypothetical protein